MQLGEIESSDRGGSDDAHCAIAAHTLRAGEGERQ
jgi:hypothetical protein